MEANYFRFLAAELGPAVSGGRIDNLHSPAEDVWTLSVHKKPKNIRLLFRPAKQAGLIFISELKPANPLSPSARVMWFRKRLCGRRLLEHCADWPGLRVAWGLSPGEGRHLVLDMRLGLFLAQDLDQGFGQEPDWPGLDGVLSDPEIWRGHPQMSPPLRRTLAALPRQEAEDLLQRLRQGRAETFYLPVRDGAVLDPRPWPEPGLECRTVSSALAAAAAFGGPTLFQALKAAETGPEAKDREKGLKRARKALECLDREEHRLAGLRRSSDAAEALKAELHRLDDRPGLARISLKGPDREMDVELDPRLTPGQNMTRLFKLAAKARRGMEHLARRRAEIKAQIRDRTGSGIGAKESAKGSRAGSARPLPERYRGVAATRFVSSDGLVILRGRNQQANHDLLGRAASPFDLWFHLADGPSAHVILKRDHPDQEVPRRSLIEAAALAALKSRKKNEAKAEVLCALVKDVRKIKGAAPGQVVVNRVREVLAVEPDPGLEGRLSRDRG
ncbi:MAG: NFACT RNA binding domain-containing protein [Desulfovibrionaceae bacterium]|nr:NFACT RNA binding domain-containing protein [Desulfovibrionaceae bacterium]